MWIATRPGRLLCKFCYQAAQVLAANVLCTACGQPAGGPDQDAIVVVKVTNWLGAHFYLRPWYWPGTTRSTPPPRPAACPKNSANSTRSSMFVTVNRPTARPTGPSPAPLVPARPRRPYVTVMTTLLRACPCSTRRRPSAVPASG
jgi:hypothetical protein